MTKLGRAFRTVLIMLGLVSITGPVAAHFHTYWPQVQGCYGKPGETVKWHYFWCHPYEMIIYDAAKPEFFLKTPSGKIETLSPKEISLADQDSGKARRAFEVEYKPAAPGDYYLCLEGQPVFIPEEKVFWQDYVKEVWHVMAEKGWDQPAGLALEIIPLTRPYGWPAG